MASAPGRRLLRIVLLLPLLAAAALVFPVHPPLELTRFAAAPGQDTVVIAAGARYAAGGLRRWLLGRHYRELWTLPVAVPVLRLDQVDGGLRPIREGGGMETRSLHLLAPSGRRYVFRSVDKEITRLLHAGLSRSLLASLLQDQTSSAHPAGVLVAARMQAAAGLPAPHPRFVVLVDQAGLDSFRIRFGGLLGYLQEAPGEEDGGPADSATEARHTEEIEALLDQSPENQVDARAYLTARLLDFVLNDWDRHAGQWRWVPRHEGGPTLWRPVPIDRDQALAWYDGALLALARLRTTKLSEFGPDYPHLAGLTRNSGRLDRRLLGGLERGAWDSTVNRLVAALNDSVIESAVAAMPRPYWEVSGRALAEILKRRRAGLPAIAAEFYRELAKVPEVHVTATDPVVELSRRADGSLEIRLASGFVRRFQPAETEGIELHLHGRGQVVVGEPGPRGIPLRAFDSLGAPVPLPGAPVP